MVKKITTPKRATLGERVEFKSQGEKIVGRLYPAAFGTSPAPAIAVLGPMTFQKEQAPTLYAEHFSQLGFATLIFDTRFRGESGGKPRYYEDPVAKGEDLSAALDYLSSRPEIDSERLAVVGICMGASHILPVAADNPRVRAVATIAAHLRDSAADANWLGSETAVTERLARGQAALKKYQKTGKADYVPAVDFDRTDVGMPGQLPWSWYQLWADRGLWENRYAIMSDGALFSFESLSAAARLAKPFLMIHSDLSAQPEAARRHFAIVPTAQKQMLWEGQTRHLQYYDDPKVIENAAWSVTDWFSRHLNSTQVNGQAYASRVRQFFELLHQKDIETWASLWHEQGKITSPYPPDGFPATLAGKDEILSAFKNLFANFKSISFTITGIYPAADSDAVCVEYKNQAQLVNGPEYANENIAVFRFRDGLISEYHDYYDPRRFQTVIDSLPK